MLGYIQATDEETALTAAIEAFAIPPADLRRIVVQQVVDA